MNQNKNNMLLNLFDRAFNIHDDVLRYCFSDPYNIHTLKYYYVRTLMCMLLQFNGFIIYEYYDNGNYYIGNKNHPKFMSIYFSILPSYISNINSNNKVSYDNYYHLIIEKRKNELTCLLNLAGKIAEGCIQINPNFKNIQIPIDLFSLIKNKNLNYMKTYKEDLVDKIKDYLDDFKMGEDEKEIDILSLIQKIFLLKIQIQILSKEINAQVLFSDITD